MEVHRYVEKLSLQILILHLWTVTRAISVLELSALDISVKKKLLWHIVLHIVLLDLWNMWMKLHKHRGLRFTKYGQALILWLFHFLSYLPLVYLKKWVLAFICPSDISKMGFVSCSAMSTMLLLEYKIGITVFIVTGNKDMVCCMTTVVLLKYVLLNKYV